MRIYPKILVATLAAIPVAAAAQPAGGTEQGYSGQQPSPQVEAQQGQQLKPAAAADINAGAEIYDQKGGLVGKVDSVDAEGVVVSTGTVRAKIPASSFALGDKGLVIGATKAELEAEAKKANKPK